MCILKYCSAAEVSWPRICIRCYIILVLITFFCENENYDANLIIHTTCKSDLNRNTCQDDHNLT